MIARRRTAVGLALALLVVLLVALALETPGARPSSSSDAPAILAAIRHEFGTGRVAGCFAGIAWRESRYQAHKANWSDVHADGSRGSFGPFQIGALWRRPGESVAAFAVRMYDPAASAALARSIYRRFGLEPWGGSCS